MADLVPIKVKITKRANGQAKYPDFNQLSIVSSSGVGWSHYIDTYGTGWIYNKVENLGTGASEGQGLILIPKAFADEAVATFPDEVTKLTEAQAKTFYDDKHGSQLPEELVNEEALKPFEVKERMGVTLTATEETKKAKALDPDDPEPGITKNPKKTFTSFKAMKNIKVVQ